MKTYPNSLAVTGQSGVSPNTPWHVRPNSHDKNGTLKIERHISFREIVLAIEAGGLLNELRHPNPDKYPNQFVFVVALDDYAYLVPYVEEIDYYFLKTIIPSRKAARDYLLKE